MHAYDIVHACRLTSAWSVACKEYLGLKIETSWSVKTNYTCVARVQTNHKYASIGSCLS